MGPTAFINHRNVEVDKDVYLHVREYYASDHDDSSKNKKNAPVVLMLHGFPDLSLTWQYHAKRLADEGYFVVAPDLRGYGKSTIPQGGVAAFGEDRLMSDLEELRKHYCNDGSSFAMIVGHDVGGSLVWIALETFGPTPIAKSAVIVNAPHPVSFFKVLKSDPMQLLKSWYMGFMQLPLLPELLYSRKRMVQLVYEKRQHMQLTKMLQSPIAAPSNNEDETTVTIHDQMKSELEEYNSNVCNDFSHCRAMIAYYRAMAAGLYYNRKGRTTIFHRILRAIHGIRVLPSSLTAGVANGNKKDTDSGRPSNNIITVPTKVIWGQNDKYLKKSMADPPNGRIESLEGPVFLDAGHFVHWEKPVETGDMLVEFANRHNK
mmetsp:Transcript_25875/g.63378  ORF Transcript_25875/g.63378 Transcript_25875/m.63378 type:complete len:374 (+) Transcript_25875:246-1367(+)